MTAIHARQLIVTALTNPQRVVNFQASDLDLLLRLLRKVRLHGRLGAELIREGLMAKLPQEAQDQFESALAMADARNRVALWELNRIAWALEDQKGVELICMKGCAYLLAKLPNTHGRIFADVDLLLREDALGSIEVVLNRRGWKTRTLSPYDDHYYRRWTHELPPLVHVERDVEIDLHHNIAPRTARISPPADHIVASAKPVKGSRFLVPSDEDTVLHAAVHLMFDSDLADRLRDLVDLNDLLRYYSSQDKEFWHRLVQRARQLGVERSLFYSLRYCERLLDCPVPQKTTQDVETFGPVAPVRWLMDRLVPRALFPELPGQSRPLTPVARLLLFVRSHWLRMPPWLLAAHLSYKFYVIHILRYRKPDQYVEG